ncbi:MAG: DUF1553 domain-containing protein [Planctomycetales bacterium]|nr:DUF1553 domain-containing protein [Planctomycetales bacterium]
MSLIDAAVATAEQHEQFFHEQVEPILIGHCLECHGADRKGELDLRTQATAIEGGESGASITPGNPAESLLYEYVSTGEMPPKQPLSESQIAVLKQWIADGAYFPDEPLSPFAISTDRRAGFDWWSLQPLSEVDPPVSPGMPAAWAENSIDRLVFAKLAEKQLHPSPPADSRTLIRRATYDLIGLPPSPAEIAEFRKACEAETGSPDRVGNRAYEALIGRLLASPRYGEHWGRHWLDVVRFGESTGFERNVIIDNAWPFRDYVIRSWNEDKPFDQFVREHLAADSLAAGDPLTEVATTFLVCGPYDNVGNSDPIQAAQIRANTVDEIIRATGETFLGLTVGCARCHDHKFDPVSQQDYYSLYAIFGGVVHGSRSIASQGQRRDLESRQQPLNQTLERLAEEKQRLEQTLLDHAEQSAADIESAWKRPPVDRKLTVETFEPVEAQYVRLVSEGSETNPRSASGYHIDEFEIWTAGESSRNVALASAGAKAEGHNRVANDFAEAYSAALTIDGRFGARWLAAAPQLTITLSQPEAINRVSFSSDRSGAAVEHHVAGFLSEYRIEVSADGENWTQVANSHDRKPINASHRRRRLIDAVQTEQQRQQLAAFDAEIGKAKAELAILPQLPVWWVGNYQQAKEPFHVFLGGNPQRQGAAVVPASLATLSKAAGSFELADDTPEPQRRQALADWIVSRNNPLTARVIANRLWHYHFGTGIVDTPSDFGYMGGRPTHPELLDWLARQLHAHQWQLKPLHRLIMTSQAYRQASDFRAEASAVDAQARLLWRFPPRRLSADEIRDSLLQIAGCLNLEMGGPGFRLYHYWEDNVATYVPRDQVGPETYRRSVYHQNARAAPVDLMSEFDSPDCAFSAPRRASTTTPLQALTLMNHSFTLDMARVLASRIDQADRNASIRLAYELLFSRLCDDQELAMASQFIEQHGLRAFCRALINTNEFVYID